MTQASTGDKIDYRLATIDDETDILEVFEEVAPEIPVLLDGPDSQDKIKTIITQCRMSGKSWVAVDANKRVAGFVLARPDSYEGKAAIYLSYIGVRADLRRRGIFSALMEKLKTNGVPLTVTVLHGNVSSMVDNLVNIGFTKIQAASDAKETKLVWSPAVTL
jgi:hypothetical protein